MSVTVSVRCFGDNSVHSASGVIGVCSCICEVLWNHIIDLANVDIRDSQIRCLLKNYLLQYYQTRHDDTQFFSFFLFKMISGTYVHICIILYMRITTEHHQYKHE